MKCLYCGKDFALQQKGSGGSNRIFCYECMPTGMNRIDRQQRRNQLMLLVSNRIKLERGCDRCGYKKCASALEWHHPDGDKQYNPSDARKISISTYLQEIEECELLCANCHREEHYNTGDVV